MQCFKGEYHQKFDKNVTSCICVFEPRLQDAVSLVSLFHMVHPHSESAQEAARQQATGTDLLKVGTHSFIKLVAVRIVRNCPVPQNYVPSVLE